MIFSSGENAISPEIDFHYRGVFNIFNLQCRVGIHPDVIATVTSFKRAKINKAIAMGVFDVMVSYPYMSKGLISEIFKDYPALNIWLDCGAFTAFRTGQKISLEGYCSYIERNKDRLKYYFALDDILDQEITRKNFDYMVGRGLSPVPVFHRFDNKNLLQHYVDSGCQLIALGCRQPFNNDSERIEWLEKVFNAYPGQRFHCLGFINNVAEKFPFVSCDSATWEIIFK